MIKQVNNSLIRLQEVQGKDIDYLKGFYLEHGVFPLFQQVLIETRTDCNNHCPFCPQSFNHKKIGVMEWGCYAMIIDQLCEIGYNGRVALMLSNEPLLDDRLCDMIMYAKGKSQRLFLDITTNGRLLTVKMIDELFKAGLDNISVNDYRADRDTCPEMWSPNIAPLINAYGNNPKVVFKRRSMNEKLSNYAGNIPQCFNPGEFGFCNYPFRKLTIAYNGDILLCCDDFMYETKFGNVMSDRLLDCWNCQDYNKIRIALLGNKRNGICSRCNDYQDYSTF